jgi:hypothetical protein
MFGGMHPVSFKHGVMIGITQFPSWHTLGEVQGLMSEHGVVHVPLLHISSL